MGWASPTPAIPARNRAGRRRPLLCKSTCRTVGEGLAPRLARRHILSMPLSVPFTDWFATRGWRVRRHQAEMLAVAERGEHTLLVAATGAGQTLAGFLPSLVDLAANPSDRLHTLSVPPLKALAAHVARHPLGPTDTRNAAWWE